MEAHVISCSRQLARSNEVVHHRRRAGLAVKSPITEWPDILFVGFGWAFSVVLTLTEIKYKSSVTIGFSLCTTIFIYSSPLRAEWVGVFIPPNVTVASVMACRLFRELKLGLFPGPPTVGKISEILFRDVGIITQQHSGHAFELRTLDDAGTDTGTSAKRDVLGDKNHSDGGIELEEGRSVMQD
jgi:hypothetical protein